MASRNPVDHVGRLATLGQSVLDAVKSLGFARRARRRGGKRKKAGNPRPTARSSKRPAASKGTARGKALAQTPEA